MKKVVGKKVHISFNGKIGSLDSLYKNCHYMEMPEKYNRLIDTCDFDEAFDFIKVNNLNSLSAIKIGKIKIIKHTNLNALSYDYYFRFNFKSLIVAEEFIDCSNDFSFNDLMDTLNADEFLEYCKNHSISVIIS